MSTDWPQLDAALATLNAAPTRTGSVIATIYGDAILPHGGALALADLIVLMRRLGAPEGVVRTAVSRLARDGLIEGRRHGRRSAYALTPSATAEFQAAIPAIYGPPSTPWDGRLHLAFPEPSAALPLAPSGLTPNFVPLAPGVLISTQPPPNDTLCLEATGPADTLRHLAARAWPLGKLALLYEAFTATFAPLAPPRTIPPLDAMAARIALIHAWRRIALRDPRLPPALLPLGWPGIPARDLCTTLYRALYPSAEQWLATATDGETLLSGRPGTTNRFG